MVLIEVLSYFQLIVEFLNRCNSRAQVKLSAIVQFRTSLVQLRSQATTFNFGNITISLPYPRKNKEARNSRLAKHNALFIFKMLIITKGVKYISQLPNQLLHSEQHSAPWYYLCLKHHNPKYPFDASSFDMSSTLQTLWQQPAYRSATLLMHRVIHISNLCLS